VKPLRYGSIRFHLYSLAGGRDLREGKPVLLTSALILSHFPRAKEQLDLLPTREELDAHATWLLVGDSTLTPA
jgi:hypothetical protein